MTEALAIACWVRVMPFCVVHVAQVPLSSALLSLGVCGAAAGSYGGGAVTGAAAIACTGWLWWIAARVALANSSMVRERRALARRCPSHVRARADSQKPLPPLGPRRRSFTREYTAAGACAAALRCT